MDKDESKLIIETTGVVSSENELLLDVPLPRTSRNRVSITITFEDEALDDADMSSMTTGNTAFDFLKDPAEDIYSYEDGKPFKYEG